MSECNGPNCSVCGEQARKMRTLAIEKGGEQARKMRTLAIEEENRKLVEDILPYIPKKKK